MSGKQRYSIEYLTDDGWEPSGWEEYVEAGSWQEAITTSKGFRVDCEIDGEKI